MAVSTSVLDRELALAFADVLSYPHLPLEQQQLRACQELARGESLEAAAQLDRFAAFATTSDGVHPLCALWGIDLLASLDSALADERIRSVVSKTRRARASARAAL